MSSVTKILLCARLNEPFDRAKARILRVPWLVVDLDRTLGAPFKLEQSRTVIGENPQVISV